MMKNSPENITKCKAKGGEKNIFWKCGQTENYHDVERGKNKKDRIIGFASNHNKILHDLASVDDGRS